MNSVNQVEAGNGELIAGGAIIAAYMVGALVLVLQYARVF